MALPNLLLPDWGNAGDKLADAYVQKSYQNQLAAALPGALKGDTNSLAALYKTDPHLGARVQQGYLEQQRYDALTKQKETEARRQLMREGLVDAAGTIVNLPETELPNAWGGIRTRLVTQFPELSADLPEQYTPQVLATAKGLAGIVPKAPGDAQIPDVIEVAERYAKDPAFRQFYDNSYKPQTYSGSTVVQLPSGGFGLVQGGSKGGSNTISLPGAPAQYDPALQAAVAGAEAQAKAEGTAAGEKEAKAPVLRSYGVAADAMRSSINDVKTGGILGLRGQASKAMDYQGVRQFENRVQQLSTELRTVFRIPGEGTLSDREQAQYGVQLPDIRNDPAVNEQIMTDLDNRINARLRDGETAPPTGGGGASGKWGDPDVDALVEQYTRGR
jgi:hypothetical protein